MDTYQPVLDFEIACYIFRLRVTREISLPAFKGSTFHGGFARALQKVGTRFVEEFYYPSKNNSKNTLPKPFIIIPPLEETRRYEAGEFLEFGLILFGSANRHFMIAFAAFETLGNRLGLGRDKGRFRIDSIHLLTLDGPKPVFADDRWYPAPNPVNAEEIINRNQSESERVVLSLLTSLRLKHQNKLVRHPPVFPLFLEKLIGRINSLTRFYGGGMLITPREKKNLFKLAQGIETDFTRTRVEWRDWVRPAGKKKQREIYGGLTGQLSYTGNLAPFIPLLALGQWTGVGGKTSFGLGLYELNHDE